MVNDPATYLARSYATLDRHAASPQGIDERAALRLLRRNARDIAPRASYLESMAIARRLLADWRNRATQGSKRHVS